MSEQKDDLVDRLRGVARELEKAAKEYDPKTLRGKYDALKKEHETLKKRTDVLYAFLGAIGVETQCGKCEFPMWPGHRCKNCGNDSSDGVRDKALM